MLSGISRETVIDLAREAGLTVVEKDIDLYDAYNADEAFLTSTSLCICPIASVNGAKIGAALPGPVTRQLTEAYCRFVDFDFVGQYLKRLGPALAQRQVARFPFPTAATVSSPLEHTSNVSFESST